MARPTFMFPWDAAMAGSFFLGAAQTKGVTSSSLEYAKAPQTTENAKSSDTSEVPAGDKRDVKTDTDGGTLTASSKVWNTTELLEQIISYLPGRDIVVVSSVGKIAYNCIANSSLAQSKLFLRPSDREDEVWWYRERRSRRNTGGVSMITDQWFEPSAETPENKT